MDASSALQTLSIILQVVIILTCLIIGAKKGGIALGLIAGIGLLILVFGFRLEPGEAPVDVILTILAVIGCAATLQQSGGLDVMMQMAERVLRRHPEQITILGPCVTWFLTVLCGTGHVVYTMLPIIADIAIKKDIRPERPMAASSVAAQMGITASPVSVATVSIVSIIAKNTDRHWSVLQILAVSIPASLCGVLLAALWSMRRGKDLDQDEEYQKRLENPEFRAAVHSSSETLVGKVFPPEAYRATWIFLGAIAVVVVLGAFEVLRPQFPTGDDGALERLSMNLVIQMVMLAAGALILLTCKVQAGKIASTTVFKAGATAMFSIFGVAWMTETVVHAHLENLEHSLSGVLSHHVWMYAIVLFIIGKLVNSQAAGLLIVAPMALSLGVSPVIVVGFIGASYGYFILPTYPSDLAAIGFDPTGTTHIGKYVINHSFLVPGLIGVLTSCIVGTALSQMLLS
ncbi:MULTISPECIES: anaerobic C4-dicarboxylate transporter [Actinomyces]|uniref:Anaerobic C4-dicarboxylate transporter n=1 Tax=Actinomyces oris TaxID=544580 RepID=A0A1Q8WHH8_9ACTO|nr:MULTISPECIES: anaerobic C4-dicarboxylate transporter [Actinomyces]OFR47484.1 anaerobic C4-dicarboxylate transporter [Actinomyces sp. HMSC075C01]OLO54349.1 anaerobic C4-dicarboxylate transporter [Actinomyces oris]OLO57265.1 anaerobic C4-dicarboxylate transporter [Actinomyces oris]OLO60114.1 anaerobic C4-dicarboxylate transporter [Actinomyces oris]OLO60193.1 anaerobic C4-dicarboxylate transporter [Actinomyces oris]